MNKRNIVIAVSGLVLIGIIVFSVIYSLTPRATLLLALAPESGSLSLDGATTQTVSNKQKISVKPGKHTVEFSRDEFDSFKLDITVENNKSVEVIIALNPLTDAARKLLLTPGSQEVVQRFGGQQIEKGAKTLEKAYPILSVLPITARLYVINSCKSVKFPNDPSKMALCADVSQDGLESYIYSDIRRFGYNPDDYEIIITNIANTEDWD